jgi:inhibitor of cysteine peptidase
MLPNTVGLFAFMFLLAGCMKNTTPIIESTETTLTEIASTQPENLKVTSTPETGMTESAPRVSPYIKVTVVDVEIRYLETNPVQIELVIRGTLPDQCKYDFYSVENRVGQNVKVSLDGIHPADNSCLQANQSMEYVLRLGRDMPESERGFSPGDYKLTVNGYQTSFSIK